MSNSSACQAHTQNDKPCTRDAVAVVDQGVNGFRYCATHLGKHVANWIDDDGSMVVYSLGRWSEKNN